MIRYALSLAVGLVCAVSAGADPSPRPDKTLLPACMAPAGRTTDFTVYRTREDLLAARQSVIDFVAATDSYAVCLHSALAALKADFAKDGRTVDPVVDRTVDEVVDDMMLVKLDVVSSFNAAADSENLTRSAGNDGRVEPLVISLDPPPPEARVPLPPDAGLLSMPARALGDTYVCDAFFPSAVRIHHRGGSVTVGYDVAADGSTANAQVLASSGNPDIDKSAIACVTKQWRNTPEIRDGVPVATTGYVATISFATSHRVGL